jgi:hypothetical protein
MIIVYSDSPAMSFPGERKPQVVKDSACPATITTQQPTEAWQRADAPGHIVWSGTSHLESTSSGSELHFTFVNRTRWVVVRVKWAHECLRVWLTTKTCLTWEIIILTQCNEISTNRGAKRVRLIRTSPLRGSWVKPCWIGLIWATGDCREWGWGAMIPGEQQLRHPPPRLCPQACWHAEAFWPQVQPRKGLLAAGGFQLYKSEWKQVIPRGTEAYF